MAAQQQKEIAVFQPVVSFQDSQIHKDLLAKCKSECKDNIIEKKLTVDQIGIIKYLVWRPRSSVAVRRVYKRPHFSAKA